MYKLKPHITGFIYHDKTKTIVGGFICEITEQDKKLLESSVLERGEVFVDNDNVNEIIKRIDSGKIKGLDEIVEWEYGNVNKITS
jgi:hypothetical protein